METEMSSSESVRERSVCLWDCKCEYMRAQTCVHVPRSPWDVTPQKLATLFSWIGLSLAVNTAAQAGGNKLPGIHLSPPCQCCDYKCYTMPILMWVMGTKLRSSSLQSLFYLPSYCATLRQHLTRMGFNSIHSWWKWQKGNKIEF